MKTKTNKKSTCFELEPPEDFPKDTPSRLSDLQVALAPLGAEWVVIGTAPLPRHILLLITTLSHRQDEVKEERHLLWQQCGTTEVRHYNSWETLFHIYITMNVKNVTWKISNWDCPQNNNNNNNNNGNLYSAHIHSKSAQSAVYKLSWNSNQLKQ